MYCAILLSILIIIICINLNVLNKLWGTASKSLLATTQRVFSDPNQTRDQ